MIAQVGSAVTWDAAKSLIQENHQQRVSNRQGLNALVETNRAQSAALLQDRVDLFHENQAEREAAQNAVPTEKLALAQENHAERAESRQARVDLAEENGGEIVANHQARVDLFYENRTQWESLIGVPDDQTAGVDTLA